VRPERVELPTFWFVAKRSIQLSYGRTEFWDFIMRVRDLERWRSAAEHSLRAEGSRLRRARAPQVTTLVRPTAGLARL
jgi:hypothetical protein